MERKYRPYLISAHFDTAPEEYPGSGWVAGASVELGDYNGPRHKDNRSKFTKWFDRMVLGDDTTTPDESLQVTFTFLVCSRGFQKNPPEVYKKYIDIMLVQDVYDPASAVKALQLKIDSIGSVTEEELSSRLREFLETEEWDYLSISDGQ